MVGGAVGANNYTRERATEIVQTEGEKHLAWMLPRMPDIQLAHLTAIDSMVQWTTYIERVMDPELSLLTCQKDDGNAMWTMEKLFHLPGAGENRHPSRKASQQILQRYQQTRASLSTVWAVVG